MSMIFNGFPNLEQAQAFAKEVERRYGLNGQVFMDADAAHEHDVFPWVQEPPVVHIDRAENDAEATEVKVQRLAVEFGGKFLGT
jgi:hypothetical protein